MIEQRKPNSLRVVLLAIYNRGADPMVDSDRVEGMGHQVKGAIKEGIGKVTGDQKTQAEGTAEKAGGKIQNTIGGAKDSVRDALDK